MSTMRGRKWITFLLTVMVVLGLMVGTASAASNTFLNGAVAVDNSSGTVTKNSETSLSLSVEGGLIGCETSTLTITNTSGSTGVLSFDYNQSGNYGTFTVAGANASTTGSYSGTLNADSSMTVVLAGKKGFGAGKANLSITNLSLIAVTESEVTFEYDSTLGSVTVGGNAVTSGSAVAVGADGAAVVATPASGAKFLGWINTADNSIMSTSASTTLSFTADSAVKAVFAKDGGTPVFGVGGAAQQSVSSGMLGLSKLNFHTLSVNYLFDDLNAAATFASSSNSKYITLLNSGTLSAGDYTIPSGVTLLIPFDSSNTLYTTDVQNTGTYTTPTAYRTLTMADGANLIVNGAVSLSAQQRYGQGSKTNGGSPTGPVSFVKMESGSNITVNNGGTLYAYGFITGSGNVTANSGATVYEMFQIMDFRGGTQSTDMDNGVFPLSQYYVQNIEVPMILYAGATEYAYTTIYMSNADFASSVAFISNSGAMFNLTSGYVTKSYDGATDRLVVSAAGEMTISSINMSVGTSSINSADYELPINGNISVTVSTGSHVTINQDLAMLPGSEFVVEKGATCTLGTGNNIYLYDADQWGNYCGPSDKVIIPLEYAPGRTGTRSTALDAQVDATVQVAGTLKAEDSYLYTTESGANVVGIREGAVAVLLPGSETVTYQLRQTSSTYDSIAITPAKLKNADGTITQTALAAGNTTHKYTYTDGVWLCDAHTEQTIAAVSPTCETAGLTEGKNCAACGTIITAQSEVAALGHAWGEGTVTTAATCTTAGVKTYTCANDPSHTKSEEIAATGHSYEFVVTAPTCGAAGYTTYTCSACGDTYTGDEVAATGNHSYESVVTAPTCGAAGYTTYTCSVCSDTYTGDEVAATGNHSYGDGVVTTPPTCEGEGVMTITCSTCGGTKTETVAATGHNYEGVEGVVTTEPGCETTGVRTFTCSVDGCDGSKTEEIAATGHSYESVVTAPTCTEKGYTTYTCSACGDTYAGDEVAANGHSYKAPVVIAPTCEEQGYTMIQCALCDYSYQGDFTDSIGHDWDEGVVTTDPGCEIEGVKTYTCENDASHTKTEAVAATGHTEVEIPAVNATCTETGLTAGVKCSVCGEVLTAQEKVDATGHSYDSVVTAPTCTENGYTTHTCSVCSDSYTDTQVPAAGHDWNEGEVTTDPTCTEKGVKTFTCGTCGETYTEEVDALGHTEEEIPAVDPSCEATGLTAGVKCSVCDEVLTAQEEVAATGHDWDEGSVTTQPGCETEGVKTYTCKNDGSHTKTETVAALGHAWNEGEVTTDPTCTEKGVKTFTCGICGETKTEEIEATGHSYESVVTKPTCGIAGYTTHTCTVCGHSYKDSETTALSHNYAGVVTKPTCEEQGYTTMTCGNCGNSFTRNYTDPIGHDYKGEVTTSATCESAGVMTYTCQNDTSHTYTEEIAALGHDYEGVVTTQPGCETEGVKTYTCKNDPSHTYTETVAATGHTEEEIPAVDATCTETGLTAGVKCSVCGKVLTAQEEVAATGHSYDSVVTAPTCEDAGYTTHTCSACGDSYTDTQVPAVGHAWNEGEVTTDPTCTEKGIKTFTCTACGETYTEEVDALGHTEEEIPAVGATCTETGLTAGVKCYVCGEVLTAPEVVEATGHAWDEGAETTAPTCTEKGIKTFTCKNDESHTYTEPVEATGHADTTGDNLCDSCGTPMCSENDHIYNEGVVTSAPTCTEKGIKTFTCTACGETYTEEVDALGHTEEKIPAVEATCEGTGLTEGVKCSICGEVLTAQTEVPATGHDWDEGSVTTQPGCETEGVKTYTCKNDASHTKIEAVAAVGHAWDEGVETTAPTCAEDGVKTFTCGTCGETRTETVPATGIHTEEEIPAVDATCTENGLTAGVKCSVCDEVLIAQEETPVAGHSYDGGVVTTDPTCTKEGVKTFTCGVCGHSYTESVAANGHAYDATVTAPTCKDKGYTTYTCSVCGDSYIDPDSYTDTVFCSYESVWHAPTCTVGGYYTYTCPTCGDSFDDYMSDPLGHSEEEIPAVDPTCTEAGLTAGVKCSVCGEILTAQEEVSELGHSEEEIPAVAPTCTETGLTAGVKCSACGEVLTAQEEVSATGHDHQAVVTAPTCEDKGYTTYTCVCGDTYTADEVDAKGHDYAGVETTSPTCTEAGVMTYICKNDETHTYTEEIEAKDHDYESVETTPATCSAPGVMTYTCKNDASHTYTEEIPTIDHVDEDGNYKCDECGENLCTDHDYAGVVTEPTCQAGGYTTYTCSKCGDSYVGDETEVADHSFTNYVSNEDATCTENGTETALCDYGCGEKRTVEIKNSALNHDTTTLTVQATCETEGYTLTTCSRCDYEFKFVFADALGHTENEAVKENEVEATCTADGSYNSVIYCGVCGEELSRETVTVPALGHTEKEAVKENEVEATCTADGSYDSVVYCGVCGEELSREIVAVPALGHTEKEAVKENEVEATCTADGSYDSVVYCGVCGEELSREIVTVPALGHTEKEAVKENEVEATCTVDGSYDNVVYCGVCGEELSRETATVPAQGHTENEAVKENEVEATCTADGSYDSVIYCGVCGEELSRETVTVSTLGHSDEDHDNICDICLETLCSDGNHVYDEGVVTDPTCTEAGYTTYTCTACGDVKEEIGDEALGHLWDWGMTEIEATCEQTGSKKFTCIECSETRMEEISALGHDIKQVAGQAPTYTAIGWEDYETCTRCDYSTYVEIPALGEPSIETFEEFVENLAILENLADTYVKKVSPGKDPAMLVIKYIRTGVDRYNSGSWNIMAGYEDADFAKYVKQYEENYNSALEEGQPLMAVTGLKDIKTFYLPNGDFADIGHVFGTMDITYHNKSSQNHADVAGWAGDLVDLLSLSDQFGVESTKLEDMVVEIRDRYFMYFEEEFPEKPIEGTFSESDVYGDLDGYYIMQQLYSQEYSNGTLTEIISDYMTADLTNKMRAEYFLTNRLDGVSLRGDVRNAVYNEYLANSVVTTLESTREFKTEDLTDLRKAVCYVFADYLCKLGGDYVEVTDNPFLTVFQTSTSVLAPGITQKVEYATTADDRTMIYYLATGDITRPDVHVYANYHNNDPGAGWAMQRVLDQANAAQAKYGDPNSELYIPNYNVIASINGDGYNMYTGEPGGLLVMDGMEWHPCDGNGFFAILADGTARIGSKAEYEQLKAEGKIKEAIGSFGATLVKDGKIAVDVNSDYFNDRASRTAVGITATGKVVFLVVDGRQGEFSCGASAQELAQIMLDAGCDRAVNLDGGGSSTYVARPVGEEALQVVSSPSDGAARSVATSLLMVSTAPSSTAFDRAVLDSNYNYLAAGASAQLSAKAVSATGNVVDMPEGVEWAVSDETIGEITQDGVFTAKANGTVSVNLMLDDQVIGSKKLYVVTPDNVYFDKANISAIYGKEITLPVKAVYEGKNVSITEADVILSLGNPAAGSVDGFKFVGNEQSGIKKVTVIAALTADETITGTMTVDLYREDEASFDFDNASGGDRQLAWDRKVSNAVMEKGSFYRVVDPEQPMVTSYTFAIDMSKIEIPPQLKDLTYMLPGADMENASAWNFLLQLAERISVLTKVSPVLHFDPSFEVDYSEMTVANEYFALNGTVYDESTNSLTLHLSWNDQSEPIPADSANPLCILSGIKLIPKEDAAWNDKSQLAVFNSGEIGYEIYMRANALYSFSQKEENQKIYGVYPFVNPNDDSEKGGYFGSTYKEFTDSYTLVNTFKDGWVIEDGGFAYYVNGEKFTGIREVDGYYYDFGDNGVNIGQTKYTGAMTDAEGYEYYLVGGLMQTGWMIVDEKNVSYYNPETGRKEKLTAQETPSTCIVDGYCIYTTESGEVKRVDYDDAGGHEYVEQADGSNICSVCGYLRIEMEDVNVTLSYYECTYTGATRTPSTTAVAPDGRVLTKPGQTDYPDYSSTYENNVEVGTASVTLKANRYGKYSNLLTWRGNAAGEITVTYEIRPDLPKNVAIREENGQAVMSWDAALAPDVTYVIYRSENGTDWVEYASTMETAYDLTLAECDGYVFCLGTRKEVDGKIYESLSRTGSVTKGVVVKAENREDGKPVLKWIAVPNAQTYEVYRSTKENGTFQKVFTTTGTSYAHTSATAGNTYFYQLKVILEDGTELVSDIIKNACIDLNAQLNVVVSYGEDSKPVLTWNAIAGAGIYQILCSETEDGEFVQLFTTEETSYVHDAAVEGVTYYYMVKTSYANGVELISQIVNGTFVKPVVSFDVTTGNNANGKPTLSWTAVEGAVSYEVYCAQTENGTYAQIYSGTDTVCTHADAAVGKTYYYKVKVVLDNGSEAYSDVVSIACMIPEVVFDIKTGHNLDGKPTLSWNEIVGADGYEVYRSNTLGGTYTKVFTTNGVTYAHVSASVGKTYYYKVRALLIDGTDAYSDVVNNTCIAPGVNFVIETGNNEDGKPVLNWNEIVGADGYEVYRSTTLGGTYTKVFTTTGTSYTHISATAGKTYYYKVKVILTNGSEEISDAVSNTCVIPGVAFEIETGNREDGKPTLTWNEIVGADGYEVYRSTTLGGTYSKVFTTTGTSYTHISATAGKTYYYKVKVILTNGSEEISDAVSNTCLIPGVTFEIETGNREDGKPTLTWNEIAGADGYEVYRSTTLSGTYTKVFTTEGTSYTHISAAAGKTYYYKVKVILTNGSEEISDAVSNTCLIPGVIFEIETGNREDGKPTLTWNKIAGADGYEVYRSTTLGGSYTKVFTTEGTSYTHISATAGKTYYYKVKVILTDGSEEISDAVSNICLIPGVTFEIETGNREDGKPILTWNKIAGADGYEVYRSTTLSGSYTKVFTTEGTSYTHISATAGKTYYYKVKVLLNDGSEEISDAVINTCLRVSEVEFDIETGNRTDGKPTMEWAAIDGAAYYEVYRATAEDGEYVKVFTTENTTYTHVSATAGRTYYYKLKVVLHDSNEEISEIVTNTCMEAEA